MSAFVCIFDRSGADLARGEVERLAAPLEGYGEILSTAQRGPLGLAVRHRGKGSPDKRRHGPLEDPQSSRMVAVAGRFSAVVAGGEEGEGAHVVPDATNAAAVALDALVEGDAGFLEQVAGSFVVIAADPAKRWMSLARDHLGDLKVYYYLDRRWLIAASEPAAILRHGAVSDDLDEHAIARFLGFSFGHTDRSFFRRIKELPPAHRLEVTGRGSRLAQYWNFTLDWCERERSREVAEREFVEHLKRSMAAQTDDMEPEQVALSLSGGLDSTALAALARRGVRAFSWRFSDLPECDERTNIEAVADHLGMPVRWTEGRGLNPLCHDFVDRFVHPNSPYINPFSALKTRLYEAAREQGCERIVVGDGGDALYGAQEYWLRDALAAREPASLADFGRTIRSALRGDGFARSALSRLPLISSLRRGRLRSRFPWLTRAARARVPGDVYSPILPAGGQTRRYDLMAGAKNTELESEERRLFAQCRVDRGNPFWHWPLLQMMMSVPAYWLYRDGKVKALTRSAMSGLLPNRVLESGRVGMLGTFFLRGIESSRREIVERVFTRPRSDWKRYVESTWLEPYLTDLGSISFGHTILWRVISYELWYRRLIRS